MKAEREKPRSPSRPTRRQKSSRVCGGAHGASPSGLRRDSRPPHASPAGVAAAGPGPLHESGNGGAAFPHSGKAGPGQLDGAAGAARLPWVPGGPARGCERPGGGGGRAAWCRGGSCRGSHKLFSSWRPFSKTQDPFSKI